MPRYIGYYPTGTANSSVTDSEGSVDKKYNSGIWYLGSGVNSVYNRRSRNLWPFSFRGQGLEVVMKVWAAGGGGANWNQGTVDTDSGGSGGFITATFIIPATTSLAIRVGAGGLSQADGGTTGNAGDANYRGGFGMLSGSQGAGWGGGQGGGYSGVFIGSRSVSNFLTIAGAGGGGGAYSGSHGGSGGAGGASGDGANGEDGNSASGYGQYGRGGTTSTGGASGGGNATAGSALTGGNSSTGGQRGAGGGGAGKYGGGGAYSANLDQVDGSGGGGGSSDVAPTSTVNGVSVVQVSTSNSSTTTRAAPNTGDSDYIAGVAAGGDWKGNGVTGGTGGAGLVVIYVDGTKYEYSTPGNYTLSL